MVDVVVVVVVSGAGPAMDATELTSRFIAFRCVGSSSVSSPSSSHRSAPWPVPGWAALSDSSNGSKYDVDDGSITSKRSGGKPLIALQRVRNAVGDSPSLVLSATCTT